MSDSQSQRLSLHRLVWCLVLSSLQADLPFPARGKALAKGRQPLSRNSVEVNRNTHLSGKSMIRRICIGCFGAGARVSIILPFLLAMPGSAPANPVVNRTVPAHSAPNVGFVLSENPSEKEIRQVRLFAEPLVPIGTVPSARRTANWRMPYNGMYSALSPMIFRPWNSWCRTIRIRPGHLRYCSISGWITTGPVGIRKR